MITRLENSEIMESAPAFFAKNPINKVSDKYLFIPSIRIADEFGNRGWELTSVVQSKSIKLNSKGLYTKIKTPYAKHMMIFKEQGRVDKTRKLDHNILIVNGHTGKIAIKGYTGMNIWACSNGIVTGQMEDIFVKAHLKMFGDVINECLTLMISKAQLHNDVVDKAMEIVLTEKEKDVFAMEALKIRFTKPQNIRVSDALMVRRPEDDNSTLWSIFNRIQENLIMGGIPIKAHNANKQYEIKTQPIVNIDAKNMINMGLWNLILNYTRR